MFEDREDAGRRLALRLRRLGVTADVVLGLPRGGVPVTAEVAAALDLPLDVIVDDGIATGATASAACLVARGLGAERVVVASPVGGQDAVRRVEGADQVICLEQPLGFQAVGAYYRDFGQTSTDEVLRLLQEEGSGDEPAGRTRPSPSRPNGATGRWSAPTADPGASGTRT